MSPEVRPLQRTLASFQRLGTGIFRVTCGQPGSVPAGERAPGRGAGGRAGVSRQPRRETGRAALCRPRRGLRLSYTCDRCAQKMIAVFPLSTSVSQEPSLCLSARGPRESPGVTRPLTSRNPGRSRHKPLPSTSRGTGVRPPRLPPRLPRSSVSHRRLDAELLQPLLHTRLRAIFLPP